jgi:hypothetical protein
VPFHVEIARSFRRARAFNLAEDELRQTVLTPWAAGRAVRLGDRDWAPAECTLRVLEGPRLDGPQLAQGQGWHNAQRTGTDVTRQLLELPTVPLVAVHAEDPAARQTVEAAVVRLGWQPGPWELLAQGAVAAAVCVLADDGDPFGAFALGLDAGRVGRARVLVLSGADVATGEHAVGVLAERLATLLG